jgi:putative endonuclease
MGRLSKMANEAKNIGASREQEARQYLESCGAKFIAANYRCKNGEIDLIVLDQDTLAFVEVRYRCKDIHGNGAESITSSKQRKIARTALYYLREHKLLDKIPCRFDAVIIGFENQRTKIDWIKDAFWGNWS